MPASEHTFDRVIGNLFLETRAERYLDIGAGSGKYGKMIRTLIPNATTVAVEVSLEYVKKFDLRSIYNEVMLCDVRELLYKPVFTEVVIMGDVLEHLPHSVGVDILQYLLYRCKAIVIVYPHHYVQFNSTQLQEEHRSIWYSTDFEPYLEKHFEVDYMHVFVLRGMLDEPDTVIPASSFNYASRRLGGRLDKTKMRVI